MNCQIDQGLEFDLNASPRFTENSPATPIWLATGRFALNVLLVIGLVILNIVGAAIGFAIILLWVVAIWAIITFPACVVVMIVQGSKPVFPEHLWWLCMLGD